MTGHIPRPLGTLALGTEEGIAAADRITIRPLGADDAERLLGLGGRLSPQSRYQRFFTPLAALPEPLLHRLLAVDHNDHEALAALADDGDGAAAHLAEAVAACAPGERLWPALPPLLERLGASELLEQVSA